MADTKINDLPLAAVSSTMQLETDTGGVTPNKVTAEGIKDYVKANLGDFSAGYAQLTKLDVTSDSPLCFRVMSDTSGDTLLSVNPNFLDPSNSDIEVDAHIIPEATGTKSIGYSDKRFTVGYFNDVNCADLHLSGPSDGVLNVSSGTVSSEVATPMATSGTLVRRASLTSFEYISAKSSLTPSVPSINFGTTDTGIAGTNTQVTVHVDGVIKSTWTTSGLNLQGVSDGVLNISSGNVSSETATDTYSAGSIVRFGSITQFNRIRAAENSGPPTPSIYFGNTQSGISGTSSQVTLHTGGIIAGKLTSSKCEFAKYIDAPAEINTITASENLNSSDTGMLSFVNSASSVTITCRSDADDPGISVGDQWSFVRQGTGAVEIVAGAGATLNSVDGATNIANQHGMVYLVKSAANTYYLCGDLV